MDPTSRTSSPPDLFRGALTNIHLSTDLLRQNRYGLAGGNPLSYIEWEGHQLLDAGGGGAASSPSPGQAQADPFRTDPSDSSTPTGPPGPGGQPSNGPYQFGAAW